MKCWMLLIGIGCLSMAAVAHGAPPLAAAWVAAMPKDSDGFATFPRLPGAKIIHISNHGDDKNSGTEDRPVKTLPAAEWLVDDRSGDAILFHRGETFDLARSASMGMVGTEPEHPFLLGAYGDPALPRPVLIGGLMFGGNKPELTYLAIQSLDFYAASRDTNRPRSMTGVPREEIGINILHAGNNLWIEDCRIRFFHSEVVIQAPEGGTLRTVVFRRNAILDAYDGKSQGMYAQHIDDLWIDECLADHNGWNTVSPAGARNMFSHNFYLQDGNGQVRFTNNLSANASSHGCQQRSGGIQSGNIFYKNPLGSFVARNESLVSNNVYDGAAAIDDKNPRGGGLEIIGCDTEVSGNVFCDKIDPVNNGQAIGITPEMNHAARPDMRVSLHGNVVFNWTGPGLKVNGDKPAGLTEAGNDWTGAGSYVDPTRDLDQYAKSIGLADADAFIAAARENRKGHWNAALTATAAGEWIRAGFAKK